MDNHQDTAARWRHRILLAGILALAAFLRLYRLDLVWFHTDAVRDVTIASDIATGQSFPLLGPVMFRTQAFMGPAYFYLLAVPFVFGRHPLVGAYCIALSNVVAVYVLFHFATAFFGRAVAVVAATLFAVFPLAVLSARAIWNPGFLPLFTLLFMHALYALIVRGHSRALIALLPLLAILLQLHFTTVALAVVALLAGLLFRPRVRGWHVVAGLAGFLLCYAPYLVYECTHAGANTHAMLHFLYLDQQTDAPRLLPLLLPQMLRLFASALRSFTTAYSWPLPFLKGFFLLYGLEAVLFGAGIVVAAYLLLTGRRTAQRAESGVSRPYALLLLWLLVPTLILGNKKTGFWWYYLDLLYPSQFIFVSLALTLSRVLVPVPAWVCKGLAAGVVLSLVLTQGWFQVAFQHRIARAGEVIVDVSQLWIGPMPSPYTTAILLPLGYRSEIVRTLWHEVGRETPALTNKVHGVALGNPQENAYLNQPFLRYLAFEVAENRQKRTVSEMRYLVTRGKVDTSGLSILHSHRVGPYTILGYRPVIDYAGWSFVTRSSLTPGGTVDGRRHKLELPATNFRLALAHQEHLLLQGTLQLPAARRGVTLAVSIVGEALIQKGATVLPWETIFGDVRLVDEAPFQVIGVQVNGEQMTAMARVARQNWRYWIVETVFESSSPLVEGVHAVDIEVAGVGRILSLDVYEGRSLP